MLHSLEISDHLGIDQFLGVLHAAFARYAQDPIPSSALFETAESLRSDVAKGYRLYGARLDGVIVGAMKVFVHADRVYFGRLSVVPEFQGRGIGTALVNHLVSVARAEQLAVIECLVRRSEPANIAMYTALGFDVVSEEVTMSSTGNAIETVTMHKLLA